MTMMFFMVTFDRAISWCDMNPAASTLNWLISDLHKKIFEIKEVKQEVNVLRGILCLRVEGKARDRNGAGKDSRNTSG